MQVDATNSWLVEGVSGVSNLFAIPVNSSTGLLVANTTRQTIALPGTTAQPTTIQQVAVSPDDTFVLVAIGSGGTATIPFNPNNANPFGTVGTIGVKNATGAALSVAFDPIPAGSTAPRLFYIGETVATSGSSNTGGLRAFNFSTTQEITGSPYAIGGLAPYSILPFSTGDFVYVVSRQTSSSQTGVIAGFSIVSANSAFALTALGSAFATGINPQAIVEDNTHAFVFAVNFGGTPDLTGYTIDATKAGYLDKVISSANRHGSCSSRGSCCTALIRSCRRDEHCCYPQNRSSWLCSRDCQILPSRLSGPLWLRFPPCWQPVFFSLPRDATGCTASGMRPSTFPPDKCIFTTVSQPYPTAWERLSTANRLKCWNTAAGS